MRSMVAAMRVDHDMNSTYDNDPAPGTLAPAALLKESLLPSPVVQEEMYE